MASARVAGRQVEGQLATGSSTSTLDVVVLGGAGHVGLPLSLASPSGAAVGIFDIDGAALDADRRRARCRSWRTARTSCCHGSSRSGRLELSTDAGDDRRADACILVIGTPVDEFLGPSMRVFERAVDQIAPHLAEGALVVLRSTVYPGTTEYVAAASRGPRPATSTSRSARSGSPRAMRSRSSARLPQIVGADTPAAGDRAEALFGDLAAQTIRTTSREAELAKLFTNTWRYMKFAVANQFFAIADQAGVDYTNVLRAIREDYPRAADLPGPGFAAGPCLFKDTMQLAAFTADHFPLGQAAMQINEGMPAYIVSALERRHGSLRGKTVGHPRHGVQGGVGRHPRPRSASSSASSSQWAGRDACCARTRTSTTPRLVPLDEVLERERDPRHRRAAPRLPLARPRRPRGRRHLERAPATGSGSSVKVLVTGAAGFICGYLVEELLDARPRGRRRSTTSASTAGSPSRYDDHPRYRLVEGDAKDRDADAPSSPPTCDQVVAAAAMIGGISYFHEFAYDLLAENERILASTFEAAIAAHRPARLERIVVLSSSMVFESTTVFPTPEGAERTSPAADLDVRLPEARVRVLRRAARWEQYQLPYTILRPFNCVGHRRAAGASATRTS